MSTTIHLCHKYKFMLVGYSEYYKADIIECMGCGNRKFIKNGKEVGK